MIFKNQIYINTTTNINVTNNYSIDKSLIDFLVKWSIASPYDVTKCLSEDWYKEKIDFIVNESNNEGLHISEENKREIEKINNIHIAQIKNVNIIYEMLLNKIEEIREKRDNCKSKEAKKYYNFLFDKHIDEFKNTVSELNDILAWNQIRKIVLPLVNKHYKKIVFII